MPPIIAGAYNSISGEYNVFASFYDSPLLKSSIRRIKHISYLCTRRERRAETAETVPGSLWHLHLVGNSENLPPPEINSDHPKHITQTLPTPCPF